MESLEERVQRFVEREGLVQRGGVLLVAVSGGPDSVCLLHLLHRLREALGVDLHVGHLNHMLRGADAAADAHYVAEMAQRLGIAATVENRDVAAYRKEHRLSLEQAAREVRYDFYCEVARSIGASHVALGHTEDDQVETIVMHLVRGAGLTGLRGMQPRTVWQAKSGSVVLLRPLLEVTRAETEEYCRTHRLEPRMDFSNYSPAFLRNRLRHQVIPLLQSCNPNIGGTLLRTARAAADDLSYIEERVSLAWSGVVKMQANGAMLDTEALLSLHPSLRRHLLRRVLGAVLGDVADIHWVHIDKMMDALAKPAGKRLSLPRGLVLHVGYGACFVTGSGEDACPFPLLEGEYALNVPGDSRFSGWHAKARLKAGNGHPGGFEACIDVGETGRDLVVRGRKVGDRFQPLGMSESKKLQDFMVDAKIPRAWRDRVPLVCAPRGIVWVVGWRIAEWAKVKDSTEEVLHLKFEAS